MNQNQSNNFSNNSVWIIGIILLIIVLVLIFWMFNRPNTVVMPTPNPIPGSTLGIPRPTIMPTPTSTVTPTASPKSSPSITPMLFS